MPKPVDLKKPLASTLVICLAFLVVGLIAIQHELSSAREKAADDLKLIADVKIYTIANWLRERTGDAQIIRSAKVPIANHREWINTGSLRAKAGVEKRLQEFRNAYNYHAILIVDDAGQPSLTVGDPHIADLQTVPDIVLQTIKRAAATGGVESTDLYPQEEDARHLFAEHVFLDFVAQLQQDQGEKPYFIIMRIDANQFLFPFIRTWPTPSESGELLLVRETRTGPVVLNTARDSDAKPFTFSPYGKGPSPDAKNPGEPVVDYRGKSVISTVHASPGLPWQVVVKEDVSEIYERSLSEITWIVVTGIMMMLMVFITNYVRYQRMKLAQSAYDNAAQQRKLAMEEELRESNQRFIDIARASPDWVWETDAEGSHFTYISDNITQALGFTPEELLGRRAIDLIPDEKERLLMQAHLAEIRIQRLPIENLEHWQPHKNGSLRLIRINGVPIIGPDNRLLGYRGTGRDITSQREKEKKVAQLSLAVEQGMNGIMITDLNHMIEYVNDAYCDLIGFSREELIGLRAGSLTASGLTSAETYRAMQKELKNGRVWRGIFHNRHKSGDIRLDSAVISPIRDSDGQITHYVGIFEDITEREQQREELISYREHLQELVDERTRQLDAERLKAEGMERLMRDAVESISQGFVLFDPDDRLVLCNSYYRNTYHEMAEVLVPGTTFLEILEVAMERKLFRDADADPQAWIAQRMEQHRCSDARPHEYQLRDGRWLLTMEFRTPSGYYVGNRVDITELKTSETLLAEARDAANAANQAKSLFLANMSHEIRSPMNAIIGMSHLCLKTDLPDKSRDYISKIQKSATLLLGIINDILDFSKVEAGKLSIEQTSFVLEEVIENSVNLYAQPLAERGIELKVKIAPDVPGNLKGDPLRLGQVLTNLLGNASKFTEKGHVGIEVALSPSRPSTATQANLMFSVCDTGLGMTPEQQGKLFQVFSQADNSITRRFGGTGLGLTISRELVELMGGRISVESSLGHGTCFSFSLPFEINADAAPAQDGQPGLRALVVDDETLSRALLSRMLEKLGVRTVQAASGQEALRHIGEAPRPFSVIFMDWRMPDMDGVETTEQIRRLPGYESTPIIMVTAGELDEVSAISDRGFERCLYKPLQLGMLKEALADLLPATPESPAQPSQAIAPLAGKRLLLVEDNEFNQIVARDILEPEGALIDIANNGQEALDALAGATYDLVLMDMQMPVMDGVTATRAIRRQKRFTGLPIIAMTANALQGEKDRCIEAGMDDFITKPIDPNSLCEVLAAWLNGERQLQPRPALQESDEGSSETAPPDGTAAGPESPGQTTFDLEVGLAFVKGKTPLYIKLLDNFLNTSGNLNKQLQDGLATRDVQLVIRMAHTLRGIAGTLGAGRLASAARKLEDQLNEGVEIEQTASHSSDLAVMLQQAVADAAIARDKLAA